MKPDERAMLLAVGAGEKPRDAGQRLDVPDGRVEYLCEKWVGKGWYEYGVTCDLGWLTPAGRAKLSELLRGRSDVLG